MPKLHKIIQFECTNWHIITQPFFGQSPVVGPFSYLAKATDIKYLPL